MLLPIRLVRQATPGSSAGSAALVFFLLLSTACETMNPRNEAGNPNLAREQQNWANLRTTPANLLLAARWAGDSLTHAAERELRENSLPIDSFRIKRLPETAALAQSLGATVAVVPVARPAAEVRVSRPTNETFAYVRPAGPGRVWRAYFTRKAISALFTERANSKSRDDKRSGA